MFSDDFMKRSMETAIGQGLYPEIEEVPHRFSRRFKKSMKKLIREQDGGLFSYPKFANTRPRRIAFSFALVIIILSMLSVTAFAFGGSIVEMVRKVFPDYSTLHFFVDGEKPEPNHDTPFMEYTIDPAAIPEGYEKTIDVLSLIPKTKVESYCIPGEQGTMILFDQTHLADMGKSIINTEGIEPETFFIGEQEVFYYSSHIGDQTLLWNNGEYVFSIMTQLDKETVLQLYDAVIPVGIATEERDIQPD